MLQSTALLLGPWMQIPRVKYLPNFIHKTREENSVFKQNNVPSRFNWHKALVFFMNSIPTVKFSFSFLARKLRKCHTFSFFVFMFFFNLTHLRRSLTSDRSKRIQTSYVYWTVHHLDSWITRDLLDVICFIISLFNAQHVSDVNTSILRSLRLIWWVNA